MVFAQAVNDSPLVYSCTLGTEASSARHDLVDPVAGLEMHLLPEYQQRPYVPEDAGR